MSSCFSARLFLMDHVVWIQFFNRKNFTCLGARPEHAKTIAIQRRIDNLGQRYYDGVISVMDYLDGLSYSGKTKKIAFYIFFCFIFSSMFLFRLSYYVCINVHNKTYFS
ncbi:unnamed protein product [Rotaria magnacalcarata]